jgi:hypothetical protein
VIVTNGFFVTVATVVVKRVAFHLVTVLVDSVTYAGGRVVRPENAVAVDVVVSV